MTAFQLVNEINDINAGTSFVTILNRDGVKKTAAFLSSLYEVSIEVCNEVVSTYLNGNKFKGERVVSKGRVVNTTQTSTSIKIDPSVVYQETEIDKIKKQSNRLVSICGKYRTVIMANGEMVELIGKRQWDKFAKNNDYVTDF
ncbi:MAG: hypothetical protein ACPGXZ_00760 [Saprospiraceae bacterium]